MNETEKEDTDLKLSINVKVQFGGNRNWQMAGPCERHRIHHLKSLQIFGKVLKVTVILLTLLCW